MLRDDSAGRDNARWLYVCGKYQSMTHIAISVNLHTRIRAVRPSTCNVMRNAFRHLIRAPHYFQTLGLIGFIYGLLIGMGPQIFSVPSPPLPMARRSRSRTVGSDCISSWSLLIFLLWKFIVVKMSSSKEIFWSTVSHFPEFSHTN